MTIFGWDMSHYDAPSIGNAISEGISFITHKAGGDGNDNEIAAWWSGVKPHRFTHIAIDSNGHSYLAAADGSHGIIVGAYWVLLPGDPAGRADAFLARLDSQCPGWRDGPFILQADCEKWNNDTSTVPSLHEIQVFCDRLVAKMPKLRPGVYAPYWVYANTLRGLTYPLWASSYVSGSGGFASLYPGDASARWVAYSGQTPAILQYSDKGSVGGQVGDVNAFRGTLTELINLVSPGWSNVMNDTDVLDVWNRPVLANPDGSAKKVSGWGILAPAYREAKAAHDGVTAITTSLTALAAALAELQKAVAGIQLQQAAGGATEAQVEQAVRNVLHGA